MDPVTAVGLVSGILSFITFSANLIKGAAKVHESLDGSLEDNRSREVIVREMVQLSAQLFFPDDSRLIGPERGLCTLASECQTLVDLEQRLDHCRSQFELHLVKETKDSLRALINSAKDDAFKLGRVQSTIDYLRDGVHLASIGDNAKAQLRELIDVQENVLHSIAQDRVLKSLMFDDMRGRYDRIEDAHSETLKWVFGDDSLSITESNNFEGGKNSVVENNAKTEASKKLRNWLSSGEGIFHISGKLGSGKSTLMKFICEQSGTGVELEKWKGSRTLVRANFFFWKPGSTHQKSLAGLLRSLLYSILDKSRDLIPLALPRSWEQARAFPWQAQHELDISEKDVRIAFSQIIQGEAQRSTSCFCFFIDGLDEYQETPQQDRRELVDLFLSWVKSSSNVKLCVSSREDNVFMNNFPAETRIRLHDLTHEDMRDYVRDKLVDLPDDETKEYLIRQIPEKAQGIFLWTTLVVKSMREQLENDDNVSKLARLLDSFPHELSDLFEHIFKTIPRVTQKSAYVTFAMLSQARKYGLSISLVELSFLETYDSDNEFAMANNFLETVDTSEQAIYVRISRTKKLLNGWCKGLIEADISVRSWLNPNVIDYTHRSIHEFLETPKIKTEIAANISELDAIHTLSQLILASYRLRIHPKSRLDDLLRGLFEMRLANDLDQAPYQFLECLCQKPWRVSREDSLVSRYEFDNPIYDRPAIVAALSMGHVQYLRWKIDHDPIAFRDDTEGVMLIFWHTIIKNKPIYWEVIDYLFEREILTTYAETRTRISPVGIFNLSRYDLRFWQHITLYLFMCWLVDNLMGSSAEQLIPRFLRWGKSSSFRATFRLPLGLKPLEQTRLMDRENRWGEYSESTSDTIYVDLEFEMEETITGVIEMNKDFDWSLLQWEIVNSRWCGTITLRFFLEKETLLQLPYKKIQEAEASVEEVNTPGENDQEWTATAEDKSGTVDVSAFDKMAGHKEDTLKAYSERVVQESKRLISSWVFVFALGIIVGFTINQRYTAVRL
ncbi:hypothetical protein B0T17DRAFT_649088 [Bombardia bombarda]|uniref:NACHT domain-containing protein n=1 Tax=Bombardia bombarda TaxID=252184 RepID=A0AA39TU70_9PEZI|nr:hypothetical protein B0T17DRAFT_649088 [Bombardia bombarda]